ncbi:MAG: bifunctional serine/threonine-protein kinase/formylglycine-generating enzyme family protein [Acidobacteriota bacterium]
MLAPNSVLQNRYLIVRQIGQGGMGAVYLARDQRLNNDVAIKETFANTDRLRKAFEREAQLLASLRHPALPVVSDHFTEGDGQFLVMQFITGDDLETLIQRQGYPFSPSEVAAWAEQLLDALDYLHTQEPPVIHRDIKPQNLKLTARGQIVLLDFGLAKGSIPGGMEMGAPMSIHGYTPNYAPLEQIKGQGTDVRSDLYSLAATLHYLLTGVMPADSLSRLEAIAHQRPDPLRRADEMNPHTPRQFADALQRALSVNRDQRPASAGEMKAMLHETSGSKTLLYESNVAIVGQPTGGLETSAQTVGLAQAQTNVAMKTPDAGTVDAPVSKPSAARGKKIVFAAAAVAAVIVFALVASVTGLWPFGGSSAIAMKSFAFKTPSIDIAGNKTSERMGEARYYVEDLGGGVTIEMVEVPGGTFLMGSPDSEESRDKNEGPQHQVGVQTFFMSRYEITQAQWRAVARLPKVNRDLITDPSFFKGDRLPVEQITWSDAVEFCARLWKKTGRAYRLPSEAEWEYACRAGATAAFGFGENINGDAVNFNGEGPYKTAPVTLYRDKTIEVGSLGFANAFGLYDMHGNAGEWCEDYWHEDYKNAPPDGRAWTEGGDANFRSVRGGTWFVQAKFCRAAFRYKLELDKRDYNVGFRIAWSGGTEK